MGNVTHRVRGTYVIEAVNTDALYLDNKPVKTTAAELNLLDGETVTAGVGGLVANRLVALAADGSHVVATANNAYVVGVALETVDAGELATIKRFGRVTVEADTALAACDLLKAAGQGKVTKLNTSAVSIEDAVTGTATSFDQASDAAKMQIKQAADVEADRGRGIVIIGSDADGEGITETLYLDDEDTSTVVEGDIEFTAVCGVYTEDGENIGAQNVLIGDDVANAGVVATLVGETASLGVQKPENSEAYCATVIHTNNDTGDDTTYITWVGEDAGGDVVIERAQLADGGASAKAKATSTTVWRKIDLICTGEFTNAAVAGHATTPDAATLCIGRNEAAVASGTATLLLKPNA